MIINHFSLDSRQQQTWRPVPFWPQSAYGYILRVRVPFGLIPIFTCRWGKQTSYIKYWIGNPFSLKIKPCPHNSRILTTFIPIILKNVSPLSQIFGISFIWVEGTKSTRYSRPKMTTLQFKYYIFTEMTNSTSR